MNHLTLSWGRRSASSRRNRDQTLAFRDAGPRACCQSSSPAKLTFGGIRKFGSHPSQHCLPRCLRNPHARHKDHRPGEQLDAIARIRVASESQFASQTDGNACPRQASGPYVPQKGRESCPKNVDIVVGALAT
jgi:hypothetical protein